MKSFVKALLSLLLLTTTAFAGRDYDYYVVGNQNNVATSTTAGTVLMGGGTDVDAAFQWMIDRSGGGDFVVIRTTGTDAYNSYIKSLGQLDSVATLVIKSRRAASDPFVLETIRNAEAVFIAGGDQAEYLRFWKGTPLEASSKRLSPGTRRSVGRAPASLSSVSSFSPPGTEPSTPMKRWPIPTTVT